MSTIIVIESRPLIRKGLVQLISETVPGSRVDAASVWDIETESTSDGTSSQESGYTLMLLSLAMLETSTRQTIANVQQIYQPESILLLSDGLAPWPQDLPAQVVGCVPIHAHPEILQASIRLALTNGATNESTAALLMRQKSTGTSTSASPALMEKPIDANTISAALASTSTLPPSLSNRQESRDLGLTPRQYEVLVLLSRGFTLKAIAQHLNIAAATAKVHAETVYQRLHVHNRTGAIYAAISRGATLGWTSVARDNADKEEADPP